MPPVYRTRNFFLRGMMLVYLCAFTSLYTQLRGLYGNNGVTPAAPQVIFTENDSLLQKLWEKPTLLYVAPLLGLDIPYTMELFAIIGILLSYLGMIFQRFCISFVFSLLWILYLSLYQVGATFLWFQWDILLLEAGFTSVLVAPLSYGKKRRILPKDRISFWLVKWLLFRLMFASGVVKLTSQCPSWWGLTALTIHYESQCIPTPLAWYLHHLPEWFHKLCVVATLVIEVILPFLFFAPVRNLKLFACYGQVLLQVMIVLSGNYNFFNLLTLVLCISLWDDVHWCSEAKGSSPRRLWISSLTSLIVYGVLTYLTITWFGLELVPDGSISSKISFSPDDLNRALEKAVPASIAIGAISLLRQITSSLYCSFKEAQTPAGVVSKIASTIAYAAVALGLFGISLVPYSTLDAKTHQALPDVLHAAHQQTSQFHLANSYGLFRSMTGLGGRPELILEGSDDIDGPWFEIPFRYKPGNVSCASPFVAPHQPRLDWQMWFAALGNYHRNPWLTSLAYRILQNEPEVVKLLDKKGIEKLAERWPPKYVKGSLYIYRYTSPSSKKSHNWWKRERSSDYLPIFSVDHQPLIDYLRKLKLIDQPRLKVNNVQLKSLLDLIWTYVEMFDPPVLILALFMSALLIKSTRNGV